MDSSESPTYGAQEGSAYNGHFGCTCYQPLFVFNQLGDVERCALRPGNVHSADSWRATLEPVVARYRGIVKRLYFRGDAAFANPGIYEFCEAEGIGYTLRLPANRVLQDRIGYLLKRPVGRPPHEVRRSFASFSYRAQSWNKSRRVVTKVEWHPGELYPRVGFIVTNLARPAARVVAFYNQRGTCEQFIKEGKGATCSVVSAARCSVISSVSRNVTSARIDGGIRFGSSALAARTSRSSCQRPAGRSIIALPSSCSKTTRVGARH